MNLGQRIRQARLEAGLSQRELCGTVITRNMLSRIEHGTVQPSVSTLCSLAERLGKTVSDLLGEQACLPVNAEVMKKARQCYQEEKYQQALDMLTEYKYPDEDFDSENNLIRAGCFLKLAHEAIDEGKIPYASELLEKAAEAGRQTPYFSLSLEREWLLLRAETMPEKEVRLPIDDRELLLRARNAMMRREWALCGRILDAAQEQSDAQWCYLRGEAYFGCEFYEQAIPCFLQAEEKAPGCRAHLEQCYLKLGDYKSAYECACRQREADR